MFVSFVQCCREIAVNAVAITSIYECIGRARNLKLGGQWVARARAQGAINFFQGSCGSLKVLKRHDRTSDFQNPCCLSLSGE